MHVLIGDDDEQTLALMATALRQWGYVVTTACDGTAARSAIDQDPDIRAVILNWMLPGLDGLALARELKQAEANIYTVVLVGRSFCDEARAAFGVWADEFVGKPLCGKALRALLGRAEVTIKLRDPPGRTAPPARQAATCHRRRGFGSGADLPASQRLNTKWN